MEDVLDVYQRPYDPSHPVVCIDECGKELRATPRGSITASPGEPERIDHVFERHGSRNIFLWVEPLAGKRRVNDTQTRTAEDFADQLRLLVDEEYPQAQKISLVLDNLNTHSAASLYERFEPEEARRIARKIEWHYTPKHGSWLNMAEIELSALSRQCLSRRIPDEEILKKELAAWEQERNASQATIDWQFTTADARIKLKRLYPKRIQNQVN